MNLALRQPHAIGMRVDDLLSRGFVTLTYPPLVRARMAEAMRSWKGFCALPIEEKRKLMGGSRTRDFGYMKREDTGVKADPKELFHVIKRKLPELREKADTVVDRRATAFIYAVDALIEAASPLVQAFAQAVERTYSLRGFEAEVMNAQHNWTFRFAHYLPGLQPVFANAHADRGGLHSPYVGGSARRRILQPLGGMETVAGERNADDHLPRLGAPVSFARDAQGTLASRRPKRSDGCLRALLDGHVHRLPNVPPLGRQSLPRARV